MEEVLPLKKVLLIVGSIITSLIILFGGIFILVSSSSTNNEEKNGTATQQGDSQVIVITAKGGYTPNTSTAKANLATTLKINTNGTYDCSSGFSIPKLNISKQLPANGTTEIQIPAQSSGSTLKFTCNMGMYSGQIKFS